ncbi:hypothetical protein QYF61_008864 [Mycteria americana]|uniref:Ubiquitin carboxyl-terminal hydrolase 4 n=1 Tax=Mycteria americana TaxID=33587 RepID=A0AAN7NUA0_MYCAM|nr:hypothetical protein QYF61_008864 [Mycteria americana]
MGSGNGAGGGEEEAASNPQREEKVSGSDDKMMGTVATPTLATGTVATPTPATGTVAEPENQPVPVSVAPIHKKKHTGKSAHLEEEEAEPINEIVTTRSLSLSELQDMQKDFSRCPGGHIVTWLLQCWDEGASSLELEGKETKQLGSPSREGGIDKAIGKGAQALSLWRRLLSGVKERYPFKEGVMCHPGKWTTMERGIQYLRELAVLEVIYDDLDNEQLSEDPDEVHNDLERWRGTNISSAIRSKRSAAQERGYSGYTPWVTLWFYLCDHTEDMRKWDGKSTSTLEARVCELQGKTITKGSSSRKIAAPVSSEQFPDRVEELIFQS